MVLPCLLLLLRAWRNCWNFRNIPLFHRTYYSWLCYRSSPCSPPPSKSLNPNHTRGSLKKSSGSSRSSYQESGWSYRAFIWGSTNLWTRLPAALTSYNRSSRGTTTSKIYSSYVCYLRFGGHVQTDSYNLIRQLFVKIALSKPIWQRTLLEKKILKISLTSDVRQYFYYFFFLRLILCFPGLVISLQDPYVFFIASCMSFCKSSHFLFLQHFYQHTS